MNFLLSQEFKKTNRKLILNIKASLSLLSRLTSIHIITKNTEIFRDVKMKNFIGKNMLFLIFLLKT